MKFGEWLVGFQRKYNQYLDQLGAFGEATAADGYATATGMDGNSDVTVTREPVENGGFRIIASGEDVTFLEFGTGVYTEVKRPSVQANFDISAGSWSAEHDGPFSRTGRWFYKRTEYIGTTPIAAMQDACTTMEQMSSTVARSVFG